MIQPISTLTPKVFRGSGSRSEAAMRTKKSVALVNATGVSILGGATATVLGRNITSSWGHAGVLGALTTGVLMMFLIPSFLYKSGINTSVTTKEADSAIIKALDSNKNKVPRILKRTV